MTFSLFPAVSTVVGSTPTWENTLFESKIVGKGIL